MPRRIILASQSSARAALLRNAGVPFICEPAGIDENHVKLAAKGAGLDARQTALTLARRKAAAVAARHPDEVVLGADQMLVCDGIWFDKPRDMADAGNHLRLLRGKTHHLVTAAVAMRDEHEVWHAVATPVLTMRAFSEAFLASYMEAEGEVLTASVGAYRYEGLGAQLFEHVEGEHAAILGLPLLALLAFLRDAGILLS